MQKVKKVLKIIGISLLVLIVVLVLGRNVIVPIGAKIGVKAMTGLTLKMDKFSIGLFSTKLDIRGLKILNPKGYQDRVMLDVPVIYVDYDLTDIIGGTIHLNEVKFALNEFLFVKQADGSSNIDGIMRLAEKKSTKSEKQVSKKKAKKKASEIQLDVVEIKIGKFVSKAYSESGKADTKEINIGIDKRYENKSMAVIASDLSKYVLKVLVQMSMNLNLGDAGELLTGTIGTIGDLGVGTAKKGLETGKEAVAGATDALKKTTDGVKNLIKLPFGKK